LNVSFAAVCALACGDSLLRFSSTENIFGGVKFTYVVSTTSLVQFHLGCISDHCLKWFERLDLNPFGGFTTPTYSVGISYESQRNL